MILKRRYSQALAVFSLALAFTLQSAAQIAAQPKFQPTETEVKAAFLYHFAQLVTWPESPEVDTTGPVVIAIVGGDPFGDRLESTIGSEMIKGRPIRIVRSPGVADLQPLPHIVFLGSSDRIETERSLAILGNKPVLTVSANAGFARRGGMIEFRLTADRRVTFDINAQAAAGAGLRISSQLLKIARIVDSAR